MSLVALRIPPSGMEKLWARKVSVMNTRHPINPALKEEGGARAAHGCRGRSCDACVSSLASGSRENQGKKHGRRGTVQGRKRASWWQSTQVAAEPGEEEQVSWRRQWRDMQRRLPPAHPTPEGAHGLGAGSNPLPSLRMWASGWSREHTSCFTWVIQLCLPCNFRLGLLCLPSPHFSFWPQSSFFSGKQNMISRQSWLHKRQRSASEE